MLYSVDVAIDRALENDWTSWMRATHIPEVLETGCFRWCEMVRVPDADTLERAAYRMVYRVKGPEAWQMYQSTFAPALQADHTARYEGRVGARRELLEVVESFVAETAQ